MTKKKVTIDDCWALIAETQKNIEQSRVEREQRQKEYEQRQKEYEQTRKEHEQRMSELEVKYQKEREQREKEYEQIRLDREQRGKIHEQRMNELEEKYQKEREQREKEIHNLRKDTGGISDGNGKFSEEYYYNALETSMTFGGAKYDYIQGGFTRSKNLPDGKRIIAEYDIVLYNGDSVALVEIKYRVKKEDVLELVDKKLPVFRNMCKEYKNHKIYLGIAGMSFEKNAKKTAKEKGIAILHPKGENVKIDDAIMTAY